MKKPRKKIKKKAKKSSASEVKDSKGWREVFFFEGGCTCLPIPILNTRVTKRKDELISLNQSKRRSGEWVREKSRYIETEASTRGVGVASI